MVTPHSTQTRTDTQTDTHRHRHRHTHVHTHAHTQTHTHTHVHEHTHRHNIYILMEFSPGLVLYENRIVQLVVQYLVTCDILDCQNTYPGGSSTGQVALFLINHHYKTYQYLFLLIDISD